MLSLFVGFLLCTIISFAFAYSVRSGNDFGRTEFGDLVLRELSSLDGIFLEQCNCAASHLISLRSTAQTFHPASPSLQNRCPFQPLRIYFRSMVRRFGDGRNMGRRGRTANVFPISSIM